MPGGEEAGRYGEQQVEKIGRTIEQAGSMLVRRDMYQERGERAKSAKEREESESQISENRGYNEDVADLDPEANGEAAFGQGEAVDTTAGEGISDLDEGLTRMPDDGLAKKEPEDPGDPEPDDPEPEDAKPEEPDIEEPEQDQVQTDEPEEPETDEVDETEPEVDEPEKTEEEQEVDGLEEPGKPEEPEADEMEEPDPEAELDDYETSEDAPEDPLSGEGDTIEDEEPHVEEADIQPEEVSESSGIPNKALEDMEKTEARYHQLVESEDVKDLNIYDDLMNSTADDVTETLRSSKDYYSALDKTCRESGLIDKDDPRPLSESLTETLENRDDLSEIERGRMEYIRDASKSIEDNFANMKTVLNAPQEERAAAIENFNESTQNMKGAFMRLHRTNEVQIDDPVRDWLKQDYIGIPKEERDAARRNVERKIQTLFKDTENVGKTAGDMFGVAQKNAEVAKKHVKRVLKTTQNVAKAAAQSGIKTVAAAAACSNPWTAAIYIALQLSIRTVKGVASKGHSNEKISSNVVGGQKDVANHVSEKQTKMDKNKDQALERV